MTDMDDPLVQAILLENLQLDQLQAAAAAALADVPAPPPPPPPPTSDEAQLEAALAASAADAQAAAEAAADAEEEWVTRRVSIRQAAAGAVLGRHGAHVRRLQADFGVRIWTVRQEAGQPGLELDVSGPIYAVEVAEHRLREIEQDPAAFLAEMQGGGADAQQDLWVNQAAAGVVVGAGGANLKYLKRELGVCMTILPPETEGEHAGQLHLNLRGPSEDAVQVAVFRLQHIEADPGSFHDELRQFRASKVHIFVDGWNVLSSAQLNCTTRRRDPSVRVNAKALAHVLDQGRDCQCKKLFTSSTQHQQGAALWRKFENAGFGVEQFNRDHQDREVGVDEAIHAAALMDITRFQDTDRVLALVTGDGNNNHGRTNFPKVVEVALVHGWRVEVFVWSLATSHLYRRFNDQYAASGRFKLFSLDNWRDELTFTGQRPNHTNNANNNNNNNNANNNNNNNNNNNYANNNNNNNNNHAGGRGGRGPAGRGRGGQCRGAAPPPPPPPPPPQVAEWPDNLCDPITLEPFEDPVVTPRGVTFSRASIVQAIQANGRCPVTREPVRVDQLAPNLFVRNLVDDFRREHPNAA